MPIENPGRKSPDVGVRPLLLHRLDHDIALASTAFGHVHGFIRVPNQMQITLAVLGVYGDAQAWSTDQGFSFQEVGGA
ncbi:hypothetical protein D3C71_2043440 [compost metagenome]